MPSQFLLAREDVARMLDIRRAIHANPELSHQEFATRDLIMRELTEAGLAQTHSVGPVGFAVDISGQGPGMRRTIGLRADMDALPIQETANVQFRSRHVGIMHACGHDSHTAMVLAAGLWFKRNAECFSGRVRLLFQHSEEALPSGARQFVEQGLADDLDAVLGIHVDPMLEMGRIAAQPGPFACSSDHFDVTILGRSSHGGRPHEGRDAIAAAISFLQETNRIRAHETDPMVPLVITAGQIAGGTAYNVIADRVTLRGTIRSGAEAVRDLAHCRLREIAEGIALMHRVSIDVEIAEDGPLLVNDAGMTAIVNKAAVKVTGSPKTLSDAPMWSASDDFAYFSSVVPGTYFRIGVGNEAKGFVHPLHHPDFGIDEDALEIGAAVLIQATLDALSV